MRLASDAALEAKARVGKPERLRQVKTLGVDGHIWRPSRIGQDRAVTIMVDLTRDKDGCLHARLLYAVVGRPGNAYKSWLQNQPKEFTAGMIPNLVGSSKAFVVAVNRGVIRALHLYVPSYWTSRLFAGKKRSFTAATRTTVTNPYCVPASHCCRFCGRPLPGVPSLSQSRRGQSSGARANPGAASRPYVSGWSDRRRGRSRSLPCGHPRRPSPAQSQSLYRDEPAQPEPPPSPRPGAPREGSPRAPPR